VTRVLHCRYSDLCRDLKNDRDHLFACLTQQQHENAELTRQLAASRRDLHAAKDDLQFAKRAVKALQSNKAASSKEAL
jgi:hypothetical protein